MASCVWTVVAYVAVKACSFSCVNEAHPIQPVGQAMANTFNPSHVAMYYEPISAAQQGASEMTSH
ncbi:Uncharacterised protein [Pseudomonas fluorescens]|uniref:Uncharacterized protein n=1 Tax=Pseudomonas fluorescens TaxID=294 RepID=A0A3S4T0G0_PSEFL|nr:Uncharacterised protein [Pseudomonas fluorescens]